MNKVSVIIPTYNREETICRAIDSVLSQTYNDYEIIVIDDGSKDNTNNLLKRYDNRIKYIYQKNNGVSSARNRGIKSSNGKYIALLDSDDFWADRKLEIQSDCMENHPEYGVTATQCHIIKTDEHYKPRISLISEKRKLTKHRKSGWIYPELFYRGFIKTSSVLIRSECFEDVGLFDETLFPCQSEDIDMWLRIARKYQVGFINRPLTIYTMKSENRKDNIDEAITYLKVLERNYDSSLVPGRLYRKRMGRVHAHMGKLYIERGEIGQGKTALKHALSLNPLNLKAIKNFVKILLKE